MRIYIKVEVDILDENGDEVVNNVDQDNSEAMQDAVLNCLDDTGYAYDPDTVSIEIGYAYENT